MYTRKLEVRVLKYVKLEIELDLLTNIDMLLMVEKGIKGIKGIKCHAIHRYVKPNNRCMKDCDKNKRIIIS